MGWDSWNCRNAGAGEGLEARRASAPADLVLRRCCSPPLPEATRMDLDAISTIEFSPLPLSLYPASTLELNLLERKALSEFTASVLVHPPLPWYSKMVTFSHMHI